MKGWMNEVWKDEWSMKGWIKYERMNEVWKDE